MRYKRDNGELDRFKVNISLIDYAASVGYEVDIIASSRNSIVMKNASDKVIIKTAQNGHGIYFNVHNEADNGSIIDFIQHRTNKNLGQVRKELRAFDSGSVTITHALPAKPKPVEYDRSKSQSAYARATDIACDNKYLTSRRITTFDHRFSNVRCFDSDGSILFPHSDSEGFSGYERKGEGFTGFSSGGEKTMYATTNIDTADTVVITETGIDAMSHALLFDSECAYVSIGGAMSEQQLSYVAARLNSLNAEIIIATDNDKDGDKIAEQLSNAITSNQLRVKPSHGHKDWNDQLMSKKI